MRGLRALCGVMVLAAVPASAVDDVRLLRLTPPSGEILGTWDVRFDWHEQAGGYVEAEFAYTMDSVGLAAINWYAEGLDAQASHGWRTFGPGRGRFTVRFSRMCTGKTPAPITTDFFRYSLSESLASGMTLRVLDLDRQAARYRFVCPERGLPDLVSTLSAPASIAPGGTFADGAGVTARNRGEGPAPGTIGTLDPANGYMVDVVLSTDEVVPEGFATFSPTFTEDVLIAGGRMSRTGDLEGGRSQVYTLEGDTIPADTPPGLYFLCARIDPGARVREGNEHNNVSCTPIRVGDGTLGDVLIDFERRSEPRAISGADATTLYEPLGVTFPSHPKILNNPPLSSGFQSLIQGDVRAPRPERTCGPLEIALHPGLHARRVTFEAHNVGFIDFPLLITATARDAAGTVVSEVRRVSASRPGRLRPMEVIDLLAEAGEGDVAGVTVTYSSCPPHVVIDNLLVRTAAP